ncbi:lipopolysaccharide export system permease protein [Winogradskyella wandonensis]|uniref:Lipopolysaccharide export system permease protein n=1 Tax=Winogradskyella wandonensis TaxID=1442586 RepID=A0A4R1KJ41_9FLAO|nr:LptF/LptG family permease [Winogradskyella wandonensis]TCK64805.1 lipopolysaccharide export system permease protein [Winogradskyella wandonensis]
MKILDRYILKTFLRTFVSIFIIFMFIFVLQGLWLYITELAGKDLDVVTTLKFIFYYSPKLIPLVVPLTVLLASIMVFGNFAENYEFAAMKSTGISLQRAMRSLSLFIVGLGIACFFFANNVIPWGEYNFYNLRRNIAKVKPALAIAEGQFNEIGNINIRVENKSGDRGQYLDKVIIHQKKSFKRGNYTTIIAEKGELKSAEDSNILKLELTNGNFYDEMVSRDMRKFNKRKPHAQSQFKSYTINIDLGNLGKDDLDEKSTDDRYNMLPVNELSYTIDSLFTERKKDYQSLSTSLYNRSTFASLKTTIPQKNDSLLNEDILNIFNTKTKIQILGLAFNTASSTSQIIQTNEKTFSARTSERNKHIIALHEKYALGFACVILFFVGAPLGALIRKGGIGLPMVIAILLFLTYHFIGIFLKNNAKSDAINPAIATWLSTLIMLPLSIYLTHRATNDKGLINLDIITVPLKKLFSVKSSSEINDIKSVQSYSYYNKHSIDDLVAVVKNHNDYDLDKKPKQIALQHLTDRNVTLNQLEEKGLTVPANIKKAKSELKDYLDYSNTNLVTFSLGAIFLVLHFVFKNNKLPELSEIVKTLSFISFGIYFLYVIVSSVYYSRFYKSIGQAEKRINPLLILLSLPFYPIKYIFLKSRVKEDFHLSCLNQIK